MMITNCQTKDLYNQSKICLTEVSNMAEIDVTRLSSKGQIVIPRGMRKGFKKGETLVIVKSGKQLILKRARDFGKKLQEDIEFARRTEEALRRYEKGEFVEMEFDEFIKQAKKW